MLGMIPQLYTELDTTKVPGGAVVDALLTAGDIPKALWWFPFVFIGIAIIGLLVYNGTSLRVNAGVISDQGAQGSLLLTFVVIEALLVFFGVIELIPFWTALLFPIWAGGWISSTKHQTLG